MQAPLRQCSPHLSWLLRIPGTALSLSCWNQSARRLSRAPEALCFGGCCHLVSIFGLAAYQQCSLLQSLLQQKGWVQRQSAVPEVVGAGGRRGGDVGANGPAKDSVTSFAVISSPGELDPRSLRRVALILLQVQQRAPGLGVHPSRDEGPRFSEQLVALWWRLPIVAVPERTSPCLGPSPGITWVLLRHWGVLHLLFCLLGRAEKYWSVLCCFFCCCCCFKSTRPDKFHLLILTDSC